MIYTCWAKDRPADKEVVSAPTRAEAAERFLEISFDVENDHLQDVVVVVSDDAGVEREYLAEPEVCWNVAEIR